MTTHQDLPLPFPDLNPWNQIPLGIWGRELDLNVLTHPHVIICGVGGSGKTVTFTNIILHAIQHPEWEIYTVSPHGYDYGYTEAHQVKQFVQTPEGLIQILKKLNNQIIQHTKNAPPTTHTLLAAENIEQFLPDPDHQPTIINALLNIARNGHKAGIHLALTISRIDRFTQPNTKPHQLLELIDTCIIQGNIHNPTAMQTLTKDPNMANHETPRNHAILHYLNPYTQQHHNLEFQPYILQGNKTLRAIKYANHHLNIN